MTRMFHKVTRTWNIITGCHHNCVYCWARRMAKRLHKTEKYREGFKPRFHPKELNVRFRAGEFVFVCDMGDMFGHWVPTPWIIKVLEVIKKNSQATFLLLTKNPARYLEFSPYLRTLRNVIAGATIETDDDAIYSNISNAPKPSTRIEAMKLLDGVRKMVSVEPVLAFSNKFADKIAEINPEFVYVGYDNYNNKLPEPPLNRVKKLIEELRNRGITVYEKTLRKAWWET